MHTIKEDCADVREVTLTNIAPADEVDEDGLDYVLCLHSDGVDSLIVQVMLYRNHENEGMRTIMIELDDCLAYEAIPRAMVDSQFIAQIANSIGGERAHELVLDRLLGCIAAPVAKLSVEVVESVETGEKDVRFTLTIGRHYRSETTVQPEKLTGFLQVI